jgi:hypothetical protein
MESGQVGAKSDWCSCHKLILRNTLIIKPGSSRQIGSLRDIGGTPHLPGCLPSISLHRFLDPTRFADLRLPQLANQKMIKVCDAWTSRVDRPIGPDSNRLETSDPESASRPLRLGTTRHAARVTRTSVGRGVVNCWVRKSVRFYVPGLPSMRSGPPPTGCSAWRHDIYILPESTVNRGGRRNNVGCRFSCNRID